MEGYKNFTVIQEISEHGRSQTKIQCPFCDEKFWVYNWSFAGSGKKCPGCKSHHSYMFGAKEPTK